MDGHLIMRLIISLIFFISLYANAYDEFSPLGIPDSEIRCLAMNIYHEARDQSKAGQLAVAFVTHNRKVNTKRFRRQNTYCKVVHQGYVPGRRDCHFSWYCDGKSDTPYETKKWKEIRDFAVWFAYNSDYVVDPTHGSTHYHNLTVEPWWTEDMVLNGIIGDHLFWDEK